MTAITRGHADGPPLRPLAVFGALVAAVLAGALFVTGSASIRTHPGVLSFAVAADMVLLVPLAWYLLLVRGAGLPRVTLIPVVVLSALLAAWVLPDGSPAVGPLRTLALLAELAVLGAVLVVAVRLRSAYGRIGASRRSFDETFPAAAEEVLGAGAPARAIAAEWVLLYFALLAWWRRPAHFPGAGGFTSHRECGWAAIFAALAIVMVAEVAAVHLLVSLWSGTAAWILTGLGVYGLVWLLGDLQALRLRRTRIGTSDLLIRIGLRWTADVPLRRIRAVRPAGPTPPGNAPDDALRLTVLGEPNWLLELDAPVEVRGPMGIVRRSSLLALQVDGDDFGRALAERCDLSAPEAA